MPDDAISLHQNMACGATFCHITGGPMSHLRLLVVIAVSLIFSGSKFIQKSNFIQILFTKKALTSLNVFFLKQKYLQYFQKYYVTCNICIYIACLEFICIHLVWNLRIYIYCAAKSKNFSRNF